METADFLREADNKPYRNESNLPDHTIIITCRNVNTGKQAMTSYSCNTQEQEKLLSFGVSQKSRRSTQDMKQRNEELQLKSYSSEVDN